MQVLKLLPSLEMVYGSHPKQLPLDSMCPAKQDRQLLFDAAEHVLHVGWHEMHLLFPAEL
jgi:hypothetical protein